MRALEIGEAAGAPLSTLQAGQGEGLLDPSACLKVVLTPDRDVLREAIALRFDAMLEAGALEEVRAFRTIPGAMDGSAAKAIGVAELGAVLDGTSSLEAARERAVARSRQYAKRQETWFRHQLGEGWLRLPAPDPDAVSRLLRGD